MVSDRKAPRAVIPVGNLKGARQPAQVALLGGNGAYGCFRAVWDVR
jgi:hypothetical protein